MSVVITLQPSAHTDQITTDGQELTRLPYPFHVAEDGSIGRQDFWAGEPLEVIGFQKDLAVEQIDLWWSDCLEDPQAAVGMYVVTRDKNGGMATHVQAIQSVTVSGG